MFLATTFAIAQCNGRYQTEIFTNVSVSTVNYSDVYLDSFHEMDIYMPDGDTVTNRPFILYMHGGSFSAGTKNMTDCVDFCTSMAKRGYVSASINYRLELNAIQFALSNTVQYSLTILHYWELQYLRPPSCQCHPTLEFYMIEPSRDAVRCI